MVQEYKTGPGITLRRMLALFTHWGIGLKSGLGGFYVYLKDAPDQLYHAPTLGRAYDVASLLYRRKVLFEADAPTGATCVVSDIVPHSGFPDRGPKPKDG